MKLFSTYFIESQQAGQKFSTPFHISIPEITFSQTSAATNFKSFFLRMEISACFLARFFSFSLLLVGHPGFEKSSSWNKRHKKHARNIAHDRAELQDAGKKALTKPCHTHTPLHPAPFLQSPPKGSSHGTVHRENDSHNALCGKSVSPERGHCGKCQKSQATQSEREGKLQTTFWGWECKWERAIQLAGNAFVKCCKKILHCPKA